MSNSEQNTDGTISFYERYSTFSDNQIKAILKNHKNYQELAVAAAVKIAIERELIHSEQDLLAPECQLDRTSGFSMFPEITNAYHYKKVVSSIFRVLFFLSLIPIIFGIMKYAEGQLNMTFIGLGIGITWLILTYALFKTKKLIIVLLQILLIIFVFLGICYRLLFQEVFHLIDMVMLVIGTVLPFYFLLYLKKLIQTKPDSLSDL
jgi:hypothetical protein